MAQFATAKNPPWVRATVSANANVAQPPPPGTSLATSILAAQATHAPTAGATAGQLAAAAVPAGTLATAAAVVAAAQTQQAQQTPVVSAAYGTGLAAITLTQSALQQGAVLQQQGIAIPASLAATTQVNSGVVVEIARLPQPGVALPTSLANTQVATVSYPAPRLLAQTAQFQAPQAHTAAAAAAVVQQAAAQASQAQPQQTLKQRVFTGTVTKLHENFGFVDEDVFFQISAVKGNIPKAGERVLVEAAYNPNMPFKWNATRIQVLPNQICQMNVQPANNTRTAIAQVTPIVTTVMTAPVSVGLTIPAGVSMNTPVANIASTPAQFTNLNQQGRWQVQQEVAVIEPIGQPRVNIQYENRIEGPHPWIQDMEYSEIMENKVSRVSVMARRHGSPPTSRRDRERDREARRDDRRERYRERERYSPPPRKRSRSPRRPSRSPQRRRPRLVPRYTVQIPKISLDVREGNVMELRKRYTNLYIPSDFCSASFLWQDAFPPHQPFSLDHPCSFHILNKDVEPVTESETVVEPSDTDYAYSAKVMLLASPSLKEIYKRSCALAEDTDDTKENFVHPTRLISFLVGLKGKNETVAIGGPWSPSLDGPNPDKDPSVLIRTAVRTCKTLTGIDLSKCSQWYRFAEIYYRRGESTHKGRVLPTRVETVVLFLPDVWSCLPTRIEWDGLLEGYKKQLLKKLHEEQPVNPNNPQDDEGGDQSEKKEPTYFADLDPNSMTISDLKHELEARGLSSKGLKSQLVARLTKAIKEEFEREVMGDQVSEEENGVNEDTDEMVDDEEKKKEIFLLYLKRQREEKELSMLEKKLHMPENPAIIVHPSKTAKNGKFDCAIMSLSLLLDYRQEDNKEHSFEVSLFAELFNEMMMRDFGFRIYRSIVEAPDTKDDEKEKEKKKNDKKDDQKYKKDEKDEYQKKDDAEIESDKDEDDSDDDECEGDEKKDRERKRKKKKKLQMYTHDPYLLLSYVYYDQMHCGYLLDKDVEEILFTLGLHLTRAQVRKLVQKVYKREIFRYRKLTDKPVTDGDKYSRPNSPKVNLEELAAGNRKIMPNFEPMQVNVTQSNGIDVKEINVALPENMQRMHLVTHQGAIVDVAQLLKQLDRSEKARICTEQRLKNLEDELDGIQELASNKDKHSQKLALDLEEEHRKLQSTEEELRRALLETEKYQRALSTCRDQLQAAMSIVDNTLRVKQLRSSSTKLSSNSYMKKDIDSNNSRPLARESSSQTTSFKTRDSNNKTSKCYDSDDIGKCGDHTSLKVSTDSPSGDQESKPDESMNT